MTMTSNILQRKTCSVATGVSTEGRSDQVHSNSESLPAVMVQPISGDDVPGKKVLKDESVEKPINQSESENCTPPSMLSVCMLEAIPLLQVESGNMKSNAALSVSSDTTMTNCPPCNIDISTKEPTSPSRYAYTKHISTCVTDDLLKRRIGEKIHVKAIAHETHNPQTQASSNHSTVKYSSAQANLCHANKQLVEASLNENKEQCKVTALQTHAGILIDNSNYATPDQGKNTIPSESPEIVTSVSQHPDMSSVQDGYVVEAEISVPTEDGHNSNTAQMEAMYRVPKDSAARSEVSCMSTYCNKLESGTPTFYNPVNKTAKDGCQSLHPQCQVTNHVTQTCPASSTSRSEIPKSPSVCKISESTRTPKSNLPQKVFAFEGQVAVSKPVKINPIIHPSLACSTREKELASHHSVCDLSETGTIPTIVPQVKFPVTESYHSVTKDRFNDSIPVIPKPATIAYKISHNYNEEFEKYVLGTNGASSRPLKCEFIRRTNDGVQCKTPPRYKSCAKVTCSSPTNEMAVCSKGVHTIDNSSKGASSPRGTIVWHMSATNNISEKDISNSLSMAIDDKVMKTKLPENVPGFKEVQTPVTVSVPRLKEMVWRKIVATDVSSDSDHMLVSKSTPPYSKHDMTYGAENKSVEESPKNYMKALGLAPMQDIKHQVPESSIAGHSPSLNEDLMSHELQQHINRRSYHLSGKASHEANIRIINQRHSSAHSKSTQLYDPMESLEPLVIDEKATRPNPQKGSRGGHTNHTDGGQGGGTTHSKVNGLDLAANTTLPFNTAGINIQRGVDQKTQTGEEPTRIARRGCRLIASQEGQNKHGQLVPYETSPVEEDRVSIPLHKDKEVITLPLDYPPVRINSQQAKPVTKPIASCSDRHSDVQDIQQKLWLSTCTSTIKSLINRPLQPHIYLHENRKPETISSIHSGREGPLERKTFPAPLASRNTFSTSVPEPNSSNEVHPPSVLPCEVHQSSHSKYVDCIVTSYMTREKRTSPAITIMSPSIIHPALSPAASLINASENKRVTYPVSVPTSSGNPSPTQATPPKVLLPTIEQISASLPTDVIHRLAEFLSQKKSAGTAGISRRENPEKISESVIDLTGDSEVSPQLHQGVPSVHDSPASSDAGKGSLSYSTPKIPNSVSSMPVAASTIKTVPKMSQFESPMPVPISLPKDMYYPLPASHTQTESLPDKNRSPQGLQTFAAKFAPTVLKLLNQKPIHSTSLHRPPAPSKPITPRPSGKKSENPKFLKKSKGNAREPVKAHQTQQKETLRLTHVMTPPPAHTKPCPSDILIEPAPPDVPHGHFNMFSSKKLRANCNSVHAVTQDKHVTCASLPFSQNESSSTTATPPISHALMSSAKSSCDNSGAAIASSELNYPSNYHLQTNMESTIDNHVQHCDSIRDELHSKNSSSTPRVLSEEVPHVNPQTKFIPNVPAPKKAISLATQRMLMTCPHPTSDHGYLKGHLSNTLPKATLQKPCCQHLTGIPPPAHTKVASKVREEIPLDLTAPTSSSSPVVDMGLDLSYTPSQVSNPLSSISSCTIMNKTRSKSSGSPMPEFYPNPILPTSITQSQINLLPKDFAYHKVESSSAPGFTSTHIIQANLDKNQISPIVSSQLRPLEHEQLKIKTNNTVQMQSPIIGKPVSFEDSQIALIEEAKEQCINSIHLPTIIPVVVEELETSMGAVRNLSIEIPQNDAANTDSVDISKSDIDETQTPSGKKRQKYMETTSPKPLKIDVSRISQSKGEFVQLTMDQTAIQQKKTEQVNLSSVPVGHGKTKFDSKSIDVGVASQGKNESIQLGSAPISLNEEKSVNIDEHYKITLRQVGHMPSDCHVQLSPARKKPRKMCKKTPKLLQSSKKPKRDPNCNTVPVNQGQHNKYGKKKIKRISKKETLSIRQAMTDIPLPADQLVANPSLVAPLSALYVPSLGRRPVGRPKGSVKKQGRRRLALVKAKKIPQRDTSIPKRKYTKRMNIPEKIKNRTETSPSARPKRATVSLGAYKRMCSCPACSNFSLPKRRRSKESASSGSIPSTPLTPPVQTKDTLFPIISTVHNRKSPSMEKNPNSCGNSSMEPDKIDAETRSDPKIQATNENPFTAVEKQVPLHLEDFINDNIVIVPGSTQNYEMPETKQYGEPSFSAYAAKELPKKNRSDQLVSITNKDQSEQGTPLHPPTNVTGDKALLELIADNCKDECSLMHKMTEEALSIDSSLSMNSKDKRTVIGTITTTTVSDANPGPVIQDDGVKDLKKIGTLQMELNSNNQDKLDIGNEGTTESNFKLILSDSESNDSATICLDSDITDIKRNVESDFKTIQVKSESPIESIAVLQQKGLIIPKQENGLSLLSSDSDSDLDLPSFSAYLAQANMSSVPESISQNVDTQQNEAILDLSIGKANGRSQNRKGKGRKSLFTKPTIAKKIKRNQSKKATVTNQLLEVIDELPDIHPVGQERSCIPVTCVTQSGGPGESSYTSHPKKKIFDMSPYIDLIRPCHVIVELLKAPFGRKRKYDQGGPKSKKRRAKSPIESRKKSTFKRSAIKARKQKTLANINNNQEDDTIAKKRVRCSGSESSTSAYSDGDPEPTHDFFKTDPMDIKFSPIGAISVFTPTLQGPSIADSKIKSLFTETLDECKTEIPHESTNKISITTEMHDTFRADDTGVSSGTDYVSPKALSVKPLSEICTPAQTEFLKDMVITSNPKRRFTRSSLLMNVKSSEATIIKTDSPLGGQNYEQLPGKGCSPNTEDHSGKADCETSQNSQCQDMLQGGQMLQTLERDHDIPQVIDVNLQTVANIPHEVKREYRSQQENGDTNLDEETKIANFEKDFKISGLKTDASKQGYKHVVESNNQHISVIEPNLDSVTGCIDMQEDILKSDTGTHVQGVDFDASVNRGNEDTWIGKLQAGHQNVNAIINSTKGPADILGSEGNEKYSHTNGCADAGRDNSNDQLDCTGTQLYTQHRDSNVHLEVQTGEVKASINTQLIEGNPNTVGKCSHVDVITDMLDLRLEMLDAQDDTMNANLDGQTEKLISSRSEGTASQMTSSAAERDVAETSAEVPERLANRVKEIVNYLEDDRSDQSEKNMAARKQKMESTTSGLDTQSDVHMYLQEEELNNEFDDLMEWEGNKLGPITRKESVDSQPEKLIVHDNLIKSHAACIEARVNLTEDCLKDKVDRLDDVNDIHNDTSTLQLYEIQSHMDDLVLQTQGDSEAPSKYLVKEFSLSNTVEPNSLESQSRQQETETTLTKELDVSADLSQETIDLQVDELETHTGDRIQVRKEGIGVQSVHNASAPIIMLGGLRSETKSLQMEKQISMKPKDMKKGTVIRTSQFNTRKTCYVGLRKLDDKLLSSMDKDSSSNPPPKVSKNVHSAFVKATHSAVRLKPRKKINKKPTSDISMPSSATHDQESILEVLQREMSEQLSIAATAGNNEDGCSEKLDDSLMPPLMPKMGRKDGNKQSPLWGYLGQVGHRIRKLKQSQKGKGSLSQTE